jgi:hypothetical protein
MQACAISPDGEQYRSALCSGLDYRYSMNKNDDKRTTVQVVQDGLDRLWGKPPNPCPKCGRPMADRFASFFLLDSGKSWTMALPICAHCQITVPSAAA